MKILCLDQSTKSTGYCVITTRKTIKYGLLKTNPEDSMQKRLYDMYHYIYDLTNRVKPDYIVFEGTQYQNNAGTFGNLSILQGLIMSIAYQENLGYAIVEPTRWRAFCKIKGRKREEQKADTKRFVAEKYNVIVSEDEADAIGIATWAINNVREN